jgi:hypothetical protein
MYKTVSKPQNNIRLVGTGEFAEENNEFPGMIRELL